MNLNEKQLSEITKCAEVQFSLTQIAIFMQFALSEFKAAAIEESNPVYLAIQRGYLKFDIIVRRTNLELARSGSGPAIQLARKYVLEREIANIYEE